MTVFGRRLQHMELMAAPAAQFEQAGAVGREMGRVVQHEDQFGLGRPVHQPLEAVDRRRAGQRAELEIGVEHPQCPLAALEQPEYGFLEAGQGVEGVSTHACLLRVSGFAVRRCSLVG